MTKVGELRERLEEHIIEWGSISGDIQDDITDLIAASHAEGVAEGAEQEAAKIVHCGECASAKPYADEPDMAECPYGCDRPIDGFCSIGTRSHAEGGGRANHPFVATVVLALFTTPLRGDPPPSSRPQRRARNEL